MILPVRTIARTMTTATLALTLVACGGGSSSTPETSPGDDIIDDDPDETTEPPASPPRIELQGTINHVTDQSGEAHLYGTVKNTGGTAATFIKAVCLFYRADSSLIRDMDGYIQGTNLAFTDINITTNTALKPGDTGVFAVSPHIKSDSISTYECEYTYDDADNTKDPDAKLELLGAVDVHENSSGTIEYRGQVKNTGAKDLTFGKVHVVTRDTTDSIIDMEWSDIRGDTVDLEFSEDTTDTALFIGSTGTYSVWTSVPFSKYGQHSVFLEWDDSDTTIALDSRSAKHAGNVWLVAGEEARNQRIDGLREEILRFKLQ